MYDMPMSLQECCLDFICDNLATLCDAFQQPDSIQTKLTFKDSDVFFHGNISEELLRTFCEKGKLTDETLSLFDPNVMNLKRVFIKDAQLSTKGLRILKTHKISELEITGLKSVTVNDVIGCLGEWTLSNLRTLNVSNSTFVNSTKFCVVVSLSKLRSLQSLNVSNTEFNKHGLEIIAEDLPCLESLDISSTAIDDILPLRKCKERLKYLSMYQLRAAHTCDIVSVLCELTKLVHLDASDDTYQSVQSVINLHPSKFKISDLLSRTHCLPKLVSLDISGKEGLKEPLLIEFLKSHPGIRYLGLALTPACKYSIFLDNHESEIKREITVTGEADEKQILECLRRYANRPIYVQRSLYTLFSFTQAMSEPREDIIKLVLPAMKNHPRQIGVQMAATACLYNLSKSEVGQKVHPSCLKEIVNLTLHAMENFPSHQQLQKNALLTLCSDRILQDVTFDRYRCAKLVMECLCAFDDPSMNRMSVAICSILAAKISTDKTATLGAKSRYMKKLLQLVRQKMDTQQIDITLKFTLSALWNLTDESPPTCHTFLNEGGLELFMSMLQVVSTMEVDTRVNVEAKILGLLNNIAEVKALRHSLMRTDFLLLVKHLLHAQQIDVSYFAAGIIAHLASDGEDKWLIAETDRHDILDDLHHLVLSWEQPQGEMVAYRSFKPFFPLLNCHATPAVQLWAVWAIQHVCTKNGHRYCLMLQEEGGTALLAKLSEDSQTDVDVVNLIKKILQLVKENVK
ncbi:hypothetical protein CHS0354_011644 [Potamilus streckersoni]|uniref:Protein zer-1 homolog-like C-terminal domain-containing protein n=1 Tax=Potamilus streckersoni TaxID=2493646 RepID=A0AAE0WGV1_9BIVA|nr:hypothetical protein CHS0354_011644 [Potamilus streckersoni]